MESCLSASLAGNPRLARHCNAPTTRGCSNIVGCAHSPLHWCNNVWPMLMSLSKSRSSVTLPPAAPPYPSLLDFLARRFPYVARERWVERLTGGKIHDQHDAVVTAETPYRQGLQLFYSREVDTEPEIPFLETIVYQDEEILVACKPHFLPVVPGGRFVNECLEQRLRDRTGLTDLIPLHRIDRETAGLVLCSVNKKTRSAYHALFAEGRIEKRYEALARVEQPPSQRVWEIENRLVRGTPAFRMQVVPGAVNARSRIELVEIRDSLARFNLQPLTGKTHQLRMHLNSIGYPILHDRYYPELAAEQADDFARPLQLLARSLAFIDPVTGAARSFHSERRLLV
jgi:tRNA pseudouridine32 synthase / 23S rRNA pseudouridine746 synthase